MLSPTLMQLGSTDIWHSREQSLLIKLLEVFRQVVTPSEVSMSTNRRSLMARRRSPSESVLIWLHTLSLVNGVEVTGLTSASQLAARKKGVEKRSLLLTTLCSVDLKRPFVHLQAYHLIISQATASLTC